MNGDDLAEVVRLHDLWRGGKDGGARAVLAGADLREADLRCADLVGADLSRADLAGAYLSRADLAFADLGDAHLDGADLHDADLRGAVGILALGPLSSRGDILYAVRHEDGLRFKAGSLWGTEEEFIHAAGDSHGAARHAVALARAVLGEEPNNAS